MTEINLYLYHVIGVAVAKGRHGYLVDEQVRAVNARQAADVALELVAGRCGLAIEWLLEDEPVVRLVPEDEAMRALGWPTLPGLED